MPVPCATKLSYEWILSLSFSIKTTFGFCHHKLILDEFIRIRWLSDPSMNSEGENQFCSRFSKCVYLQAVSEGNR